MNKFTGVLVLSVFFLSPLRAQVFLAADSAGDAYKILRACGYDYEVPDCNHAVRHITTEWDNELRKPVLVFTLHGTKTTTDASISTGSDAKSKPTPTHLD